MAKYVIDSTTLSDIADSIRAKKGTADAITPEDMPAEIESIETGSGGGTPNIQPLEVTENGTYTAPNGVDGYSPVTVNVPTGNDFTLQSKSVTPSETEQTVTPDSGYDGLSQVSVGAISKTYVGSGVTRKAAQTYTPGTSNQTIASGQYLNGTQTIAGDTDLVAGNIKKGVTIFNVLGTFEGESSGGLPSGVSALDSGTFTPTENYTSGVMVKHNLGVIPNFFLWWLEDDVSATTITSIAITGGIVTKYAKYTAASSIMYNVHWFVEGYNSSQLSGTQSRVSNETYMTSTECRMHTNSTYPIKSGYTYHWVCGVVDGVA